MAIRKMVESRENRKEVSKFSAASPKAVAGFFLITPSPFLSRFHGFCLFHFKVSGSRHHVNVSSENSTRSIFSLAPYCALVHFYLTPVTMSMFHLRIQQAASFHWRRMAQLSTFVCTSETERLLDLPLCGH